MLAVIAITITTIMVMAMTAIVVFVGGTSMIEMLPRQNNIPVRDSIPKRSILYDTVPARLAVFYSEAKFGSPVYIVQGYVVFQNRLLNVQDGFGMWDGLPQIAPGGYLNGQKMPLTEDMALWDYKLDRPTRLQIIGM